MSEMPEVEQTIDLVLRAVEKEFGALGFVCLAEVMDCIRNVQPASSAVAVITVKEVDVIFDYWRKVMNSPRSVLDDKRRKLIVNALKLYSPADVCKAIRGCSKSPHNMGDNPSKRQYNGLNLILRDAEHIDTYIKLDAGTARAITESAESKSGRGKAYFSAKPVDDGKTFEMGA
jgi:hypothetical protein